MHFVTCPKQGLEMEAVVLHRVGFSAYFCPKQGQDFKPSAAPLYPNFGQVPPPPPGSCPIGLHSTHFLVKHSLGDLVKSFITLRRCKNKLTVLFMKGFVIAKIPRPRQLSHSFISFFCWFFKRKISKSVFK